MKKKNNIVMAAVAAVLMISLAFSAWPAVSCAVEGEVPVPVEQECSMKVFAADPSSEMAAELDKTDIEFDIYRLADALAPAGSDDYSYSFVGDFGALSVDKSIEQEGWQVLSQKAAQIILEKGIEPSYTSAVNGGRVPANAAEHLKAGLYLIIARGSSLAGPEEYIRTAKDGRISGIANNGEYTFAFAPQIAALPSKNDLTMPGVSSRTTDVAPWIKDVTVYLKPSMEDRKLDLTIVKTLSEFVGPEKASFVFKVSAEKEEGGVLKTVYSRILMMDFAEGGEKSITLKEVIPVGAKVTVEEVYEGQSYSLKLSDAEPVIAAADAPLRFSFTNEPDGFKGGGGAENRFTLDESGSWQWQKLADDTAHGGAK